MSEATYLVDNYFLLMVGGLGAEMVLRERDILKVQAASKKKSLPPPSFTLLPARAIKKRVLYGGHLLLRPYVPAEPSQESAELKTWTWFTSDGTPIRYRSVHRPEMAALVPFWKRAKRVGQNGNKGPLVVVPAPRSM